MSDVTPTAPAPTSAPGATPSPQHGAPSTPRAADLSAISSSSATPPPKPGATDPTPDPKPGETNTAPRTYKLNVYGSEREIPAEDIDKAAKLLGLDPQELTRVGQLKGAAYKLMEEARAAKREREQWEASLKSGDPWEVLKKLGRDPDQLAVERIRAIMEQEQMTPEQRALQARAQELAKREADLKAHEKAQREAKSHAEVQAHRQRFDRELPEAMKVAGLPPTPDAARYVLAEMQRQAKVFGQVDVAAAARDARGAFLQHAIPVVRTLPVRDLMDALGKDVIAAIQREVIGQHTAPPSPPKPPAPPANPQPERRFMTTAEWRAWNNS